MIKQFALLIVPFLLLAGIASAATYYVDASGGNDSKDGLSQETAWKTISKAAQKSVSNKNINIESLVIVKPGIYRESVNLNNYGGLSGSAWITFQAEQAGTVNISGCDIWNAGWTNQGNGVFTHDWPYDWGVAANPWVSWGITFDPLGRRREMIFINGTLLREVNNQSEMSLSEGTFYVDEINNLTYIHVSPDTNLASSLIEVSVRSSLWQAELAKNIALKGLTFQQANSQVEFGAVNFYRSSDILVEDCQVNWNNWNGLNIGNWGGSMSPNITVKRTKANNNGNNGMGCMYCNNSLFEDSETSKNGWRARMGNLPAWDTGQKFGICDGITFRRHKSYENEYFGLWFDWNNKNVIVEDCDFSKNKFAGLFLEVSPGPFLIKNCTISNNSKYGGIYSTETTNVTLERNRIFNNNAGGLSYPEIFISGQAGGRDMGGILMFARDWTIANNSIYGSGMLLDTPGHLGTDWKLFLDTLKSDNNYWYNPNSYLAFDSYSQTPVNLSRWQQETGEDMNSIWSLMPATCHSLGGTCCVLTEICKGEYQDAPDCPETCCSAACAIPHKADTNKNGCIETAELGVFIDRWKMDNLDVTIRELIEAISLWKAGC